MISARAPCCFLCEKTGGVGKCDGKRPCNLCTASKKPQMCYYGTSQDTTPIVPVQMSQGQSTGTVSTPLPPLQQQEQQDQNVFRQPFAKSSFVTSAPPASSPSALPVFLGGVGGGGGGVGLNNSPFSIDSQGQAKKDKPKTQSQTQTQTQAQGQAQGNGAVQVVRSYPKNMPQSSSHSIPVSIPSSGLSSSSSLSVALSPSSALSRSPAAKMQKLGDGESSLSFHLPPSSSSSSSSSFQFRTSSEQADSLHSTSNGFVDHHHHHPPPPHPHQLHPQRRPFAPSHTDNPNASPFSSPNTPNTPAQPSPSFSNHTTNTANAGRSSDENGRNGFHHQQQFSQESLHQHQQQSFQPSSGHSFSNGTGFYEGGNGFESPSTGGFPQSSPSAASSSSLSSSSSVCIIDDDIPAEFLPPERSHQEHPSTHAMIVQRNGSNPFANNLHHQQQHLHHNGSSNGFHDYDPLSIKQEPNFGSPIYDDRGEDIKGKLSSLKAKSRPKQAIQPHNTKYQSNVNSFFMQELKKIQLEYKKMQEEMMAQRMQNLKLSSELESLRNITFHLFQNRAAAPTHSLLGANLGSEPPVVIYDLTQRPARVISANQNFCELLGYSMNEVIGSTWAVFIPPDRIEQTMRNLVHDNLKTSQLVVEQWYRHKSGASFRTQDSLKIFHDGNKNPVTAIVTINPPNEVETLSTPSPQSSHPLLLSSSPSTMNYIGYRNDISPPTVTTPIVCDDPPPPVYSSGQYGFYHDSVNGYSPSISNGYDHGNSGEQMGAFSSPFFTHPSADSSPLPSSSSAPFDLVDDDLSRSNDFVNSTFGFTETDPDSFIS